tara:strand:- start:4211 stop:5398 length:1188 start_codon:yes stop_codon:yes gene_type:complete
MTDPRDFVVHINTPLLARYLKEKYDLTFDVVEGETGGDRADRFIDWLAREHPDKRDEIFVELNYINDLSGDRDIDAMIAIARASGVDVDAEKDKYEQECSGGNRDEYAMWWFLTHPDIFEVRFHHSDLEDLSGAKEWLVPDDKIVSIESISGDKAKLTEIEQKLMEKYQKELRGEKCIVTTLLHDNTLVLRAYIEDIPRGAVVFEGARKINPHKPEKPVFSIVWLYTPEDKLLRTKSIGRREYDVAPLENIFTTTFLSCTTSDGKQRVFDLKNVSDVVNLNLTCEPTDEVERVFVRAIEMTRKGGIWKRIRLQAGSRDTKGQGTEMIKEAVKDIGLDPNTWEVKAIEMQFVFKNTLGKGRKPQATVRITPNGSNLKNRPHDTKIRRLLKKWEIAN